ncbi:MAG: MlaD family protein [Rhodanobacteraceae bacterium]
MKRDNINYALVGGVVVVALVILLAGLALITGQHGASTDYSVHYRNVTGLRYGAPVFYQGYRIGEVTAVTPERNAAGTRYRVTLAVRRDWPIPDDSPARLQSSGLLADVSIAIHEGTSHQMLKPGGELRGIEGGDLFEAMNELAGEVTNLTRNQLSPLIRNLAKRVDSITATVDESAPAIMAQTRALLDRMNRASDALNDVLKPENRAAISDTLGNVRKLSRELRETRATLDEAVGSIAAIAKENRPGVRRAVDDLGSILRSLSSRMDAISHHLDSASRNLDEFSREIRKNPNRLILAPKADKLEDQSQ